MSTQPTLQNIAAASVPCASCAAPLGHDQRYCLHCGEVREGARRPMPAVVRGPAHVAEESVAAAARDPGERPTLATVLAGLACLLLAMGVGVLIGRSGDADPVTQAPITIAGGATPAAATPASANIVSDWPSGKDGWTVALSLLPKTTTTSAAVEQAKAAATAKGASAVGALDADAYPTLTAGSYVVYSGVFDDEKAAKAALKPLLASFPDARVAKVGQSTSATPVAGAKTSKRSTGATKSKTAGTIDPATKKADEAKTTKAFEKSKKAPKTVGTGGKPPPKDNKPAAGGEGFQDIG